MVEFPWTLANAGKPRNQATFRGILRDEKSLVYLPRQHILHIHGEAGKSHLDLGYPKENFTPEKYSYDARGKGTSPYVETKIENYVNGIEDYYVRAAYEELVDKCKSFYKESRINLLKDFLYVNQCEIENIIVYGHADDFVIFCADRKQAMTMQAQMTWFIKYRLRLDLAPEKAYIVNLKQKTFQFLGLEFTVQGNEYHKCFPQKNIKRYKTDISSCLETNNITLLNQKSQGWKNYSDQHSTDKGQFEILQQHLVHEMVAAEQPYYYAAPEDMLLLPEKMQISHPTIQDLYIANHDNTEEIILPIK